MIGKTRVGCLASGVVIFRVRNAPLRQAKSDARRVIHPIEAKSRRGGRCDSPPCYASIGQPTQGCKSRRVEGLEGRPRRPPVPPPPPPPGPPPRAHRSR